MDRYDRKILALLQQQGRVSWSELAEQINLSASAAQRRVASLVEDGVVSGFKAVLDPKRLGYTVHAQVEVNVERSNKQLAEKFRQHVIATPEVLSCYMVSGSVDYILEVVATDIDAYARFIEKEILEIDGVKDASSTIFLRTIKQPSGLPVE
jgi:Lrp/AsnC family leucine-responsive transcriptional regulator